MADYNVQNFDIGLIGSAASPVTLESAYGAARSGVLHIGGAENVLLLVSYTTGAAETNNVISLKYELSSDGTTYAQMTDIPFVSGAGTVSYREDSFTGAAAGTQYLFTVPLTNVCAKSLKVWAKETGVGANKGTCYIVAITGGK
jgi:hypothetical protein